MQTNINLSLLNSNYIFFYGFSFCPIKPAINLGQVQGKDWVYDLYAITKRINMPQILSQVFNYLNTISFPGDDTYYVYIPDIITQVLQIAALRSQEEFNFTLKALRNHPKLQEWYQDDEEGTLEILEDDDPDLDNERYNNYKNYQI